MLATMQRMQHKLTQPPCSSAGQGDRQAGEHALAIRLGAQAVQQLVDSASRSALAARFPHPELGSSLPLSTKVVKAGRPELLAVKEAFLDTRRPLSAAAVQQRKTFLSDPRASSLFGGDPIIAPRAATQLQRRVAAHPEP